MNFDDLRKDWQAEVTRPISPQELQQQLVTVQARYGRLERSFHWREMREILAAIFVVIMFAAGWPIFRKSFAASLGAGIIVVWALVVVILVLAAGRRNSAPFAASLLDYANQRLDWLDRQICLLQLVIWWYAAPFLVGYLLIAWGLRAGNFFTFGFVALIGVGVAVSIAFLNLYAVHNSLLPARKRVAELIETLESEN